MKKGMADRFLNPRRKLGSTGSARWYYFWQIPKQVLSFLNRLRKGKDVRRHTTRSHEEYQSYDDWELRIYEKGSAYAYNHGIMKQTSLKETRAAAIAPVITEIRKLLDEGATKLHVLEVGCGNGVNLVLLNEEFGDQIEIKGIDLSAERMRVGREYWGEKLEGVEMVEDSVLTLSTVADDSYDVVYSTHCLEQVPYNTAQAVAMMQRVSRNRVIFVEPVFEFCNTAQKLFMIFTDYQRTLLPEIEASGLKILECNPGEVLVNPLNKTGIVITQVAK
jgi:2-polyprenyl-3-methyl-5-hydroxy-6-metoxy-1,4-benzoquinol methylase